MLSIQPKQYKLKQFLIDFIVSKISLTVSFYISVIINYKALLMKVKSFKLIVHFSTSVFKRIKIITRTGGELWNRPSEL
jgi:hypothetical protein